MIYQAILSAVIHVHWECPALFNLPPLTLAVLIVGHSDCALLAHNLSPVQIPKQVIQVVCLLTESLFGQLCFGGALWACGRYRRGRRRSV